MYIYLYRNTHTYYRFSMNASIYAQTDSSMCPFCMIGTRANIVNLVTHIHTHIRTCMHTHADRIQRKGRTVRFVFISDTHMRHCMCHTTTVRVRSNTLPCELCDVPAVKPTRDVLACVCCVCVRVRVRVCECVCVYALIALSRSRVALLDCICAYVCVCVCAYVVCSLPGCSARGRHPRAHWSHTHTHKHTHT